MSHTRRELLTAGLAFVAGCAAVKPKPKIPRTYNLGEDLLVFEHVAGIDVSENCYERLQEITAETKRKIDGISEPLSILKTIFLPLLQLNRWMFIVLMKSLLSLIAVLIRS